jgi:hypothetical protein
MRAATQRFEKRFFHEQILDFSLSFEIVMSDIWASKSLNLVAPGKLLWFGKVTKLFLLLTLLTVLYFILYDCV